MGERGQASIELLVATPFLTVLAVLCLQLLGAGFSASVVDGAAEAGALALAAGRPIAPAIEAALPAWARDRAEVERERGSVTVRLRPPSPIVAVGRALEVSSTAWVRPPAAEAG